MGLDIIPICKLIVLTVQDNKLKSSINVYTISYCNKSYNNSSVEKSQDNYDAPKR